MIQLFRCLSLTLALFLVSRGNVAAHPPYHWEEKPPGVSVEFLVAGNPLPQLGDRSGDVFVAVPRWGVEYEIRITNHESRDRVLFVIGVDGLSVMDGRPASQRSGGYVLDPGETARIRGWRRGDDRVAAFTFTSKDASYAGSTGRRGHIGEVWVWAIREMSSRPEPKKAAPSAASRESAGAPAHRADGETGTGYGDELVDHVRTTRFVRSDAIRHLTYRYGLRHPVHPYHRGHDAEPGESFTPPPPGWKR